MNSSDLNRVFNPRSVAVFGASEKPTKLGCQVLRAVLAAGFKGNVYPVNPQRRRVQGLRSYSSIREIHRRIDLAGIAVPAHSVVSVIEECCKEQVECVVMFGSGFRESGDEGRRIEDTVVRLADSSGLKIIGPNCLGIMNPYANLNLTFYPLGKTKRGNLAIASQSGGIGQELVFRSIDEDLGLSLFVSLGNQANVGFADVLGYLESDRNTRAIAMFIEGVDDGRKLMNVAQKISEEKIMLGYKAGRTEKTVKAAMSHTGAIAGSYALYKAAFRQAGVLEVTGISELVDAAKALLMLPEPKGCRAAILTHSAGPGIIAAETLEDYGIRIAEISEKTKQAIRGILPLPISAENPVDILGFGAFDFHIYGQAMEVLSQDKDVDALLAIHIPLPSSESSVRLPWKEIIQAHERTKKPLVACIVSRFVNASKEKRKIESHGIPVYQSPERASKALANYLKYWQRRLHRRPRFVRQIGENGRDQNNRSQTVRTWRPRSSECKRNPS